MKKLNWAKILELSVSIAILTVSLYTLYSGFGESLAMLIRERMRVDIVHPLASLGAVLGILLLLDAGTSVLSRVFREGVAFKELLVAAIPFYMAGGSLIVLVLTKYNMGNLEFSIAYAGGLLFLYAAFWLTGQALTTSPLSLEIRKRGLHRRIPWYHRLPMLRIRGFRPVAILADKLDPLARRLYPYVEQSLLPYTRREVSLLMASTTFILALTGIGLSAALAPVLGVKAFALLFLAPSGIIIVATYFALKREDRREEGEENALWLALLGRLAARLGVGLHSIIEASGFTREARLARRLLEMGGDPLTPLEKHPSDKVRLIVRDYKDIIESGGDPEAVLADWQDRLLREHESRMERYVEEATTLLEAILILLGLGPLIALLAGSIQGSIAMLRLYTIVLLPLGIAGAAVLSSRLPRDKAQLPIGESLTWLIAGLILGLSISTIIGADPAEALAATLLAGLTLFTLKHRGLLDQAEKEKQEATRLLRLMAESLRTGIPLLGALENMIRGENPKLKQLYLQLIENLRRKGRLEANTLHDTMKRTLKLAQLLYHTGATAHDYEQTRRYIEAIVRAERDARARLRVLIALIPLLPFIIVYSLKLAASHITSLNTIPSVTITGEFHGGSLTPPPIPWELLRVSIVVASLGLGVIAGRIYYGRWDNVRLALLSVASALLALLLL